MTSKNFGIAFSYLENPEKVKKRNFEKQLRKLNKPLFKVGELD